MMIREMFAENINRPINGVIQVEQDTNDVIEQEVREYVITKELKRHFRDFFNYYSDAFETPTADIGVWISGFFGSGKSHFLKMLSYLLENKTVGGVPTVELFRQKFSDDPGTFMLIDRATRGQTETILFNIDIEGSINKDRTAVLRVFAKMFYNHLGFYGDNLKVAMLEQYIDQLGKTQEFRRVFEEKKGMPWMEQRKVFAFNGKYIIPTLMEVLDMSEADAEHWFRDKTAMEFSIAQLVADIKAYVDSKPKDFRLLFMIDEVGQYVGTDTDLLLNLQSLVEKIGSDCGGKVWVMCTGQEAVDEIVRVRTNEFSRIQARFKTRLSLTSSSVDEVVQKRILKKTPKAESTLEELYNEKDSVLRNLIQFQEARKDLVGFNSPGEFAKNFPFVPYQFTIMQTVYNEIRIHGNVATHQSEGERSMLSGFQEATQAIQEKDEYALVPLYRFYDTVHTFLNGSITRVIERCEKQAGKGQGIEPQDVDVLKLLYLVRYVDDIPKNVENLLILMADRIDADKILLRKQVQESLDRLLGQNYIGRSGDTYHFLTDEEQDIQREIQNTNVDTNAIVDQISKMIFADIYTTKKFRYGRYDFDFNKMVDGVVSGSLTEGMKLRFLTVATDPIEKTELRLMTQSKGEAIVVLPDSRYYENLESAMKVTKYVKQRNVAQMPKSAQDIIGHHQDEAKRYEGDAREQLKKAIEDATYYVDGERVEIKGGDAKAHIDAALEYLVGHVYSDLDLITKNVDTDAEILAILSGEETTLDGMEPNRDAAAKVEEHLTMQDRMKLPTSMSDIQSRYSGVPYGWREIDIAAVVALLIYQQKVTIKYGGATIRPDDPKLPDLLRKRSEVGKTTISIHHTVTAANMKAIRELLREYFEVMDVPNDEMNLVKFILDRFTAQKSHLEELNQKYTGRRNYPDHDKVTAAIALVQDILSQQKDNIALISRVLKREDDLFDSKEDLQNVEGFFQNQVQIFDAAAQMEEDFRNDLDYLSHEPEANAALNQIRLITQVKGGFSYRKIPELNGLMTTVTEGHERLLEAKREELTDLIYQCVAAVHQASGGNYKAHEIVSKADTYYEQKKQTIKTLKTLALLDGLIPQMLQYKDATCGSIEVVLTPPKPVSTPKPAGGNTPPAPKKIIKPCQRAIVFPAKTLESEADIDTYVEQLRQQLKTMLRGCDGLQIK